MDPKDTINDILVNLFNEILKLEEEAIITDEFKDITNNDMHIIEASDCPGKTPCLQWRNVWGSQPVRLPLP